jgi:hypothetical protein
VASINGIEPEKDPALRFALSKLTPSKGTSEIIWFESKSVKK